jgi:hypothetical protein
MKGGYKSLVHQQKGQFKVVCSSQVQLEQVEEDCVSAMDNTELGN